MIHRNVNHGPKIMQNLIIEKTLKRTFVFLMAMTFAGHAPLLSAQEEDEEETTTEPAIDTATASNSDQTKALDSTASQWSFQAAYQTMPDYFDDEMSDGQTRPAGATDYVQLRGVAPLAYDNFTILPRLTLRHYENAQGDSGIGNTEAEKPGSNPPDQDRRQTVPFQDKTRDHHGRSITSHPSQRGVLKKLGPVGPVPMSAQREDRSTRHRPGPREDPSFGIEFEFKVALVKRDVISTGAVDQAGCRTDPFASLQGQHVLPAVIGDKQ